MAPTRNIVKKAAKKAAKKTVRKAAVKKASKVAKKVAKKTTKKVAKRPYVRRKPIEATEPPLWKKPDAVAEAELRARIEEVMAQPASPVDNDVTTQQSPQNKIYTSFGLLHAPISNPVQEARNRLTMEVQSLIAVYVDLEHNVNATPAQQQVLKLERDLAIAKYEQAVNELEAAIRG